MKKQASADEKKKCGETVVTEAAAATADWDVVVHCGEGLSVRCSSYILKTRSEYFRQVVSQHAHLSGRGHRLGRGNVLLQLLYYIAIMYVI
jgi:hypothetical protein